MTRPDPPGGHQPPASVRLGDASLDLVALATAVSDRFFTEFPGDYERYGDAGIRWCIHDNQWVFLWAAYDVGGAVDLIEQVRWLARVLAGRDYPLDRLVRSLEIAGEVAGERVPGHGADLRTRLRSAAAAVAAAPG